MKLLDVNITIAAALTDHAHHALVRPWFDGLVGGPDPFTVPDVVWASFVRIVTNGNVLAAPLGIADAFAFSTAVRNGPTYRAVVPGDPHLDIFERLCIDFDIRGPRVTDAYLAAIAIEHACTLVSLDRDFARFEGLDWERPT